MAVNTSFDITIRYSGDPTFQPAFNTAAQIWQQIITADIPDVNSGTYGFIDDLLIDASVVAIDGPNGILGQAGPDDFRSGSGLPDHGIMQFDSADVQNMFNGGSLLDVILHEMGHILGIGTLWSSRHLSSGFNYTGSNGVAEYRALSGNAAATSVPLESTGGAGTAGAHWSEAVFDRELMTGFIDGSFNPLSRLTIAALKDIGYSVDIGAADPYALPGRAAIDDVGGTSRTLGQLSADASPTQGSIEVVGDHDWWRVSLSAGVGYTMKVAGAPTGSGTLGDPMLRLYDGTGHLVAQDDDFGGSLNAQLSFTPSASGTFYVGAGAHNDGFTGTYLVNVATGTSGQPNQPVQLAGSPNLGTFSPAWSVAGVGDFNGDGTSDILWRNPTSGQMHEWKLANGQWAGSQDLGSYNPAAQVAGIGDLNGDGTSDVLWRNPSTGQLEAWILSNGQWAQSVQLGSHGSNWQVAGIGDFNADGTDDILWRNPTTGQMDEWRMANGNWAGSVSFGSHGTNWTVAGVGDLNHDGTEDVLWRNPTTGQLDEWKLVNGQWAGSVDLGSYNAAYQVAAINDFNGDGTADVLWRNPSTGQVEGWVMQNGQWAGSFALGSMDPAYAAAGSGDFNHSGTADILWRNATSGQTSEWLLIHT